MASVVLIILSTVDLSLISMVMVLIVPRDNQVLWNCHYSVSRFKCCFLFLF